jgi:hypothetical protein
VLDQLTLLQQLGVMPVGAPAWAGSGTFLAIAHHEVAPHVVGIVLG